MTRSRLALLLLGLSAAVAPAQPPAAPTPVPLIVTLLPCVEDENFGKELKLTPDQVKKFVEFRKKQWDAQYSTAPAESAKGDADRDQATVALFKELLSAEQHKRAQQLAAQNVWGNRFGGFGGPGGGGAPAALPPPDVAKAPATALNWYAELAEPLNLTDAQKKLAAAGANQFGRFATTVFLTAEQSKVAKELLGEPVKTAWNTAFDQRQNRIFGNMSIPLFLTQAKDIRTEIAMTDEQVKALAPLLAKWQPLTGPGGGGFPGGRGGTNLSAEAQDKQVAELTAETEKALAATLKPEQLTRLRQIEQQIGGPGGGGFGPLRTTVPLSARLRTLVIQKALAITADQMKALSAADGKTRDAIAAAVAADGSVDDAIKAVTAVHADHEKACAAVLTADQTKKLDEMMGKPFTGSTLWDRVFTTAPEQIKQMRTANFGQRPFVELTLLAQNPSIQGDLKLSPEQIKKAADAVTEYRTKFPPTGGGFDTPVPTAEEQAKLAAERSGFIAKAVEGILTVEQAKRFRELMLQRADLLFAQPTGPFTTSVGAVGHPGVAEAVKLTAEQKKKLLDDGAKPDDVLTADQKLAIQGMLGKKFEGNFNFGKGGFNPRNTAAPTTADVLLNVNWDVFKITPEQATKLVPVANEYQLETMPTPVQGGQGPGVRFATPAVQAAANEKLTKVLAAILTPEQAKRVEQVRYQLLALRGLTYLTNAEVAKALDLKEDQKAKIAAVLADSQRLSAAARGPLGGFNSFGTNAWITKLTEKTTARAMAVLTDEQKATWKALTGDPVPNLRPINQFGGFGGPGGFGGF